MPKDDTAELQVYLTQTVYAGTASTDTTTNIIRRLKELTGDYTARLKSMMASAGSPN